VFVGTADGLFQYDGSRFQGWGMEEGLPSPFVRALLPEGGGRLWIGTARGLALREAGRIRALRTDKGLPEGEVFALAKDSQGRLWVAMDVGLFRQIPGADRFEGAPGWGQGKLARALLMDGSSLLVAHQEHLLAYDVTRGGAPRELPGPWKERLDSLLKDRQGRLWVRSRAGLWMRPGGQAPFQDLSGRLKPATYDGNLALTPGGDLLIPTLENLVRVRGDEWKAVSMGQGLPSSWTNRAMEDREGCLWVGGLGRHRDLARQSWRQHTIQDGITEDLEAELRRIVKSVNDMLNNRVIP
jgi:ligand-binding sensor domain-containing protein